MFGVFNVFCKMSSFVPVGRLSLQCRPPCRFALSFFFAIPFYQPYNQIESQRLSASAVASAVWSAVEVPEDLVLLVPRRLSAISNRPRLLRLALLVDALYVAHSTAKDHKLNYRQLLGVIEGRWRQIARMGSLYRRRLVLLLGRRIPDLPDF